MAWTDVDSSTLAPVTGLSASQITSGQLALARGGTASDLSATGGTSHVLKQASAGAVVTVGQLAASDLSNGTTGSGAAVLATSPTLVTPTLGAATATSVTMNSYSAGAWVSFTPTRIVPSGTWSGGTVTAKYTVINKTMIIIASMVNTTITGTPEYLAITLPNSVTSGTGVDVRTCGHCADNGTASFGLYRVAAASNEVQMYPTFAAGAWSASAANASVYIHIAFEIQ
jgi:hypothetical protein